MPDNPSPFPSLFPRPENHGEPTASTPTVGVSPYMTDPAAPAAGSSFGGGRKSRRVLFGSIGAAAIILLGLGGGAAWAVNAHGDYPYQHVAAGATVYAQLNLTPSLLERMQADSFLSKLPKTNGVDLKKKVETSSSVAKAIVDSIAPDNTLKDYSWAGNRYAVVGYGSLTNLSSSQDSAFILDTKDPNKAVTELNSALSSGSSPTGEKAQVLDGNYVIVGTDTGIASATNKNLSHLDADASFTNAYKSVGDPLSYWAVSGKQVVTGSLSADWGTMKFTSKATGSNLNISQQAQAANETLTENNSVANPIINVGLANPEALLGPDSATGKALLAELSSIDGSAATTQVSSEIKTVLTALGDNVSFSANDKNGRVLLHGATEANLDAAITKIVNQPTTVKELLQSYSQEGTDVKLTNASGGLLFTYGSDAAAAPVKFTKAEPGVIVAQVDLDKMPADILKKSSDKWGTVSLAVSTTSDGTQADAEWVLP